MNDVSIKEQWKAIEGYSNLYKISNLGRIKNRKDYFLSPPITPKGYIRVNLFNNGIKKNHMIHRLVASAFLPNDNNREQVNHKDGNKSNNIITNLEWTSASENQLHAYKNGLKIANVKYTIHCVTLNIYTKGCEKMVKELRNRGFDNANAASIWACVNSKQNTHLDLIFKDVTKYI